MITRLQIRNFKRFVSLGLPLAPLTVLTGRNGGGKSTVLQALLLARQAALRPQDPAVVELNGLHGLELGDAQEVLHVAAQNPRIEIGLTASDGSYVTWQLDAPEQSLHLLVAARPNTSPPEISKPGRWFCYVAAERGAPRDAYPVDSRGLHDLQIGPRGEFVAQFLEQFGRQEVRTELRNPRTDERGGALTLSKQTEYWLSDIVRPVEIATALLAGTNVATIRFKSPGIRSSWLRPGNVGFGFSYCLPPVVAGLATYPGGLLLVENPEAHLHPEGQSLLAGLLARVAASGVQVIVETHSDHVLNGVRREVLTGRGPRHSDVIIHWFDAESSEPAEIRMTAKGGLTNWPRGFFDQIEVDLAEIARQQRS